MSYKSNLGKYLIIVIFLFPTCLYQLDTFLNMPLWLYNSIYDFWDIGSLLLVYYLLKKEKDLEHIWKLSPLAKQLFWFLLFFLLLFLWAIFSMIFLPQTLNGQAVAQLLDESLETNKLNFIIAVIGIGPVREELIFRGLVMETLKKWEKYKLPLFGSASLFSLWHIYLDGLRATDFITYFLSGLIFACFYKKTASITWTILLHITWNSFVYYMSTR